MRRDRQSRESIGPNGRQVRQAELMPTKRAFFRFAQSRGLESYLERSPGTFCRGSGGGAVLSVAGRWAGMPGVRHGRFAAGVGRPHVGFSPFQSRSFPASTFGGFHTPPVHSPGSTGHVLRIQGCPHSGAAPRHRAHHGVPRFAEHRTEIQAELPPAPGRP